MTALVGWLQRAVPATPQERAAALWSFAYFFTLLAGYYVLRPLRDQMGIAGGVRNLPCLFTPTFVPLLVVQPLYGALVATLPRARILRLGQRVQPVRGRSVLVVHGRPVRRRAGQAAIRFHRRRRHSRRTARSGHHDRTVGAAGPDQSADRGDGIARSGGVLHLPARARGHGANGCAVRTAKYRRGRLRRAARADPVALSARRRRVGQPAVVRRDNPLF